MNKSCGGCKFWLKLSSGNGQKLGLCELQDARSRSDSYCNQWSGIKYTRRNREIIKPELDDYE